MKKLLILFLILINCGVLAENNKFTRISTYEVDAVDPTPAINAPGKIFPGYRGADQLIIYTPKFGSYTDTNEYGREASVVDGRVVAFNGANSFIPQNGFVISAHGKAKKWLNQSIMEGAFVSVDYAARTIKSEINPESYLFKARHKLNEVQKIIIHYKKNLPGYEYTDSQRYYTEAVGKFQQAKYYASKNEYERAMEEVKSSLFLSQKAFYNAIPGKNEEFQGIWLRPTEHSRSEIKNTLDRLKETGIENVFLETYYQGYTIYPSKVMEKYGITPQRPEFKGWNPLKYWIKEAHKRDMKIHAWFQVFYTGNQNVGTTPGHILYVYPDWANVQRKNALEDIPMPSCSEHNGYFLDPANHRVRQFLLSLIDEITSKYDIDGLNIDYIRYPKSLTTKSKDYLDSTWGYTEYAREEFKNCYGKDPLDINENHRLWPKWINYRQDKITEFVSQLKKTIDDKDIIISAVIFPDTEETQVTKLQKWQDWAQNGYLDAFTPLIMSSDEVSAKQTVEEVLNLSGGNVLVFPGLFEPFTAGSPNDLLHQIVAVRSAGAEGLVIFDYAHLNEEFVDALKTRAFKD